MADLQQLFQLGQQMQGRLQQLQTELAGRTIETSAGGGMVRVTADGRGTVRAVVIDPGRLRRARRRVPRRPGDWRPWRRRSAARPICCRPRCGRCRTLPFAAGLTVSAIDELITELARLPGIGRKTAQRLTFHLLQQPPEQAGRLAAGAGRGDRAGAALRGMRQPHRRAALRHLPRSRGATRRCCAWWRRRRRWRWWTARPSSGAATTCSGAGSRPLDGIGPEALRLDQLVQPRAGRGGPRGDPRDQSLHGG